MLVEILRKLWILIVRGKILSSERDTAPTQDGFRLFRDKNTVAHRGYQCSRTWTWILVFGYQPCLDSITCRSCLMLPVGWLTMDCGGPVIVRAPLAVYTLGPWGQFPSYFAPQRIWALPGATPPVRQLGWPRCACCIASSTLKYAWRGSSPEWRDISYSKSMLCRRAIHILLGLSGTEAQADADSAFETFCGPHGRDHVAPYPPSPTSGAKVVSIEWHMVAHHTVNISRNVNTLEKVICINPIYFTVTILFTESSLLIGAQFQPYLHLFIVYHPGFA